MIEKPALITFITAGDPDIKTTLEFMLILEKYADVIELGIPFSDPMADGKVIQKANVRALKAGTKIRDIFSLIKSFRELSEKPVVLMSYLNPIYRMGVDKFISKAKEVGVDGMIIVDLPVEESDGYLRLCRKTGMGTIFLAAPNTSDSRLKMIDEASTAFVYLISLFGTTGSREQIPKTAFNLISRAKRICKNPVAVGFGVSKAEHVGQLIKAGADGVVVGSALVEIIEEFGENAGDALEEFVKQLRRGLDF